MSSTIYTDTINNTDNIDNIDNIYNIYNINNKDNTENDNVNKICQELWMNEMLKQFILSTLHVWKCMYENHIIPIKKSNNVDVFASKKSHSISNLTRYVNYAKDIKDYKIKLPDWFLLSSGSNVQKIIPCYESVIDMMPLALIDSYVPRGKTFILAHMSETMLRNGLHVSDTVTRYIFKAFSNFYCLDYMKLHIVSPEICFMIRDHYAAYYEHLKFALLEKNIKRMIFLSSRQVLIMLDVLRDMKDVLIDEIVLLNSDRGKKCKKYVMSSSYKNIFEKLWPSLEIIILLKDGYYKVYTQRMKKYTGDIKLYSPVYFTPEVTMGYNINEFNNYNIIETDRTSTYVLDSTKGYFEFIPIKNISIVQNTLNNNKIQTIGIRQLKIGDMYNIVVSTTTTCIHRYITGDIVRVIDYYNGSPEIELICKESDLIVNDESSNNIAKPNIAKSNIVKSNIITPNAILDVLLSEQIQIIDFCYKYDANTDNAIRLYIEIELDEDEHIDQTIKDIDILNILSNKLNIKFEVRIVRSKTFEKIHKDRYSEHIDPALVQIPRLIIKDSDINILRENILFMY